MFVVPPILMFFNAHPLIKKEHLMTMHHAVCGAAPLGKEDVDQFYERFEMDDDKLKFCQGNSKFAINFRSDTTLSSVTGFCCFNYNTLVFNYDKTNRMA